MELATFAAGCFWGVEYRFSKVEGIIKTTVGYTGGNTINPTYKQVCSGESGHAEAIQIQFNPDIVSYRELLRIFWMNHNPTTPNKQDVDIGNQYRSAVFYYSKDQYNCALEIKQEFEEKKIYTNQIVTQITKAVEFYPAEEYHQKYYEKNQIRTCLI